MLGGPSAEREVSLRSGTAVAKALRSAGHEVIELDPQDTGWTLPTGTDAVFLALHGTYGEDGMVQRRLDLLGVPYTGCDAEASRVAFDKVLSKKRFIQAGVPTPRFAVVDATATGWPANWGPPAVLKPVRQGSSVGLRMIDRVEDWQAALTEALRHDTEALLEERIGGREATVGILGQTALPVIEVRPKQGVFDYQNKYTKGATDVFCPGRFDGATAARIQTAALEAFKSVGGRDYSRVDVMVGSDGKPMVLEVNTLPGMTELSLFPRAAAAAGLTFPAVCEAMIEMALRHPIHLQSNSPPATRATDVLP